MNSEFEKPINRIHTEATLIQDQIEAEPTADREVKKFIELEKKKYKKSDDLKDIINKY